MDEIFEEEDINAVAGSDAYLQELESLQQRGPSTYGAEDVLELNRARYAAEQARENGYDTYADRVEDIRDTFFDPLKTFDKKARQDDIDAMNDQERTFLHYPGPPHDFIEAAEQQGMEAVKDELSQDRLASLYQDDFTQQQLRLNAVAKGAKTIAADMYNDVQKRFDEQDMDGFDYDSVQDYAEQIAFNATLAAEYFFEETGDLVYAP